MHALKLAHDVIKRLSDHAGVHPLNEQELIDGINAPDFIRYE